MAQTGDGTSATDSTGTTNQLGHPVRKLYAINRGATEVKARVTWTGGRSSHPGGMGSSDFATLQANEDKVFSSPPSSRINGFFVSTASGTSTVDWSVIEP
jgi:hypothetical protein